METQHYVIGVLLSVACLFFIWKPFVGEGFSLPVKILISVLMPPIVFLILYQMSE
jgi:hypothetical protein